MASLALRPVNASQLALVSAFLELRIHCESQRKHIHSHIEDVVLCLYKEKIRGCAGSLPRPPDPRNMGIEEIRARKSVGWRRAERRRAMRRVLGRRR